jgi:hypothetical protein
MTIKPMCTHAGVVSQDECPYCERDEARAYCAQLQDELLPYRQQDTPGIAACMRLNAKLRRALEKIAGPTPCGGAMVEDEDGNPFSPELAELTRIAHLQHCVRCVAREALGLVVTSIG